jgi:hypothetical protein
MRAHTCPIGRHGQSGAAVGLPLGQTCWVHRWRCYRVVLRAVGICRPDWQTFRPDIAQKSVLYLFFIVCFARCAMFVAISRASVYMWCASRWSKGCSIHGAILVAWQCGQ